MPSPTTNASVKSWDGRTKCCSWQGLGWRHPLWQPWQHQEPNADGGHLRWARDPTSKDRILGELTRSHNIGEMWHPSKLVSMRKESLLQSSRARLRVRKMERPLIPLASLATQAPRGCLQLQAGSLFERPASFDLVAMSKRRVVPPWPRQKGLAERGGPAGR